MMDGIRSALYRTPLLLPCLAALSAITVADGSLSFCFLLFPALILCFLLQGKKAGLIALALCLTAGSLHYSRVIHQQEATAAWRPGTPVSFSGSVTGTSGKSVFVQGFPENEECTKPVKIEISLPKGISIQTGKKYLFHGIAQPLDKRANPGEFDRASWLKRMGVSASIKAIKASPQGKGNLKSRFLRASQDWNRVLSSRLDKGLPPNSPEAEVLKSLLLGARQEASQETIEPFRRSGLLHIFAVSGLHVGLVALLITPLLSLLRLRPALFACILSLVLFAYDFSTGLSVSANRATLMIIIYVAGWAGNRQSTPANRLALAALVILLLDSQALFQMGFQLSFLVFGSVIAASSSIEKITSRLGADPYIPDILLTRREKLSASLKKNILALLFISFSAWVTASLILIPSTHYVSTYAPLANTLLTIPVTLLMGAGMLCLALGWLPVVGPLLFKITEALSCLLLGTAQFFAGLPGSFVSLTPPPPPGRISIYSLYGSHYSAIAGNPSVLFEAGSTAAARGIITPALFNEGFSPSLLCVSHYHKAQSEGAEYLINTWRIPQYISPRTEKKPHRNQQWSNGTGGTLTLLDAPATTDRQLGGEDELAWIFLWEYKQKKILFLGDAGFSAEQRLRKHYPDLRANIVVLGTHALDLPISREFLLSLTPEWIVYTEDDPSRSDSRQELPHQGVRLHSLRKDGYFQIDWDH